MLQSSGPISLANIQTEFGGSNPISLSEYYGAATGIPGSGTISMNQFYGKVKPISFNVSQYQCMDHYASVYYDGYGNFYIESREPSGAIHTGRGDCGGYVQGQILYYSFNPAGYSTINFSVYESGRNGSGTYSYSWAANSGNRADLGVIDGSGGAGTYYFNIYGTIT